MSNLLEQASLVMIPSGYEEDVVYSEIPLDGSGDLQLTRASNGTRVNSAGLVEVCPWNLLQYSEDFANAFWSKDPGATVDSNVATAPNGTTTADRLNFAGAGQAVYTIQTFSGANTFSVYLKGEGANIGKQIYLELPLGQNVTLTGEWQRFEVNADNATSVAIKRLNSGQASAALAWGVQVNAGTLKPYFPTTDRLNVPRLTYQNGGGGCPSLLLEKQSTNINTYSEDFSNAVYSQEYSTITTNQTTSPDGTSNADKFTDNSTNNYHIVYPNSLSITTSRVTASIYVKNNDIQFCAFQLATSIGGTYDTRFTLIVDLINGTITDTEQVGTPNAVYSIQNVGNGWYRLNLTCDHSAGSVAWVVGGSNSGTPLSYLAALPVYVGTGKSLFVWGAQLEASSYATSYIPTTSSSATRVADSVGSKSLSSVGITSNYTLFFQLGECNLSAASSWILQGSSGANTPFQIYGTTAILYTSTGYLYPFSFVSTNPNNSKVAVSYNGTNIKIFLDGVKVGQWTSTSEWANLNDLYLTYNPHQQLQYKQVVLFNVGLSDADGIALTTL